MSQVEPNTDKYTVAAAVAHAISAQPLEFEKATQHILAAKLQDRVEAKRIEVAHSMFGAPTSSEEEQVEAPEVEVEVEAETDVEPETPEET